MRHCQSELQVMRKAAAELDKSIPDAEAASKLLDEVSLISIRGVSWHSTCLTVKKHFILTNHKQHFAMP